LATGKIDYARHSDTSYSYITRAIPIARDERCNPMNTGRNPNLAY